jgi:hypothetical protein
MKNILLGGLFTAILLVSGYYIMQNYQLTKKTPDAITPTAPSDTNNEQQMPSPQISAEESDLLPDMQDIGTIEGTFNFPSEGLPKSLIACAVEITTQTEQCTPPLSETGQTNSFSLEVPAGTYHVYATDSAVPNGYKAYYNEFVTCGLNASCPSHSKIAVVVNAGQTTSGILPHDWYDQP